MELFILEGVQLSISLVSTIGVSTIFTLETCRIFIQSPKITKLLSFANCLAYKFFAPPPPDVTKLKQVSNLDVLTLVIVDQS